MENKPTLEEVREYFKNAENVIDAYTGQEFNMNEYDMESISLGDSATKEDYIIYGKKNPEYDKIIFDNKKGYAKILTYKEKTFSITESQIKGLSEEIKISPESAILYLKEKLFPEAFESEVKLEVGKWYFIERPKSQFNDSQRALVFYEDKNNLYGFTHGGWWTNEYSNPNKDNYKYTEATESEVLEALKNEAVKRGFVKGIYISETGINECFKGVLRNSINGFFSYHKSQNILDSYNGFGHIFNNGQWAEIIPTISKAEAEKQLNKKIID